MHQLQDVLKSQLNFCKLWCHNFMSQIGCLIKILFNLLRHKFFGFLFVGGFTTLTNLIVFSIAIYSSFSLQLAIALGNASSIAINYFGLKSLFNGPSKFWQVIKYLLSLLSYYFISLVLMVLLQKSTLDFSEIVNRIIVLVLLTPPNYVVQKKFVFIP